MWAIPQNIYNLPTDLKLPPEISRNRVAREANLANSFGLLFEKLRIEHSLTQEEIIARVRKLLNKEYAWKFLPGIDDCTQDDSIETPLELNELADAFNTIFSSTPVNARVSDLSLEPLNPNNANQYRQCSRLTKTFISFLQYSITSQENNDALTESLIRLSPVRNESTVDDNEYTRAFNDIGRLGDETSLTVFKLFFWKDTNSLSKHNNLSDFIAAIRNSKVYGRFIDLTSRFRAYLLDKNSSYLVKLIQGNPLGSIPIVQDEIIIDIYETIVLMLKDTELAEYREILERSAELCLQIIHNQKAIQRSVQLLRSNSSPWYDHYQFDYNRGVDEFVMELQTREI